MFGSATLAIVVSSACISVASITDTTSRPRLATSRWVASVWLMDRDGYRAIDVARIGMARKAPRYLAIDVFQRTDFFLRVEARQRRVLDINRRYVRLVREPRGCIDVV